MHINLRYKFVYYSDGTPVTHKSADVTDMPDDMSVDMSGDVEDAINAR